MNWRKKHVSLAYETPSAKIWMCSREALVLEAWFSVWPCWEGGALKMWGLPQGN